MKLPFFGPADVVGAATAVRDGIGDALDLLPRLGTIVGGVEALLVRVTGVVDRVEQVTEHAATLVADIALTGQAADKVVLAVDQTAIRAGALLDLYEDSLRTLAPTLRTLADSLDPGEVQAMVDLVDRLPVLVKHLDEDILPVLATLDRVGPDIHALLEIAQDLQVALDGMPGMGWIRKRAEDKEEDPDH